MARTWECSVFAGGAGRELTWECSVFAGGAGRELHGDQGGEVGGVVRQQQRGAVALCRLNLSRNGIYTVQRR